LIKEHPDKLTTAIVRAGLEIKVPDMEGDEGEVQLKTYKYYKAHYFDNVDFANPGLLRSPLLFNRVESYLERLTPRHPDSIAIALTIVLDEMKPSYETFKYYLIHYLNEYAQSKIVGMDAVYVRLVDEYYRTGDADWTDPEQLKKILSNAQSIKPTLIGKTAPDIAFENRAGEQMNLHEMSADYTVLYIWQPDCGHCKKQTPKLIKFYEDYKESGVEVVAVCMKFTDEVPKCWEYIDSRPGMELFYNLVDPYNRSKYPTLYYVKSTPQLFVLDKDKKILTKRIGVEQLPEVMDALMKKSSDTD
jgi:thiol-disulfide isomerase/thioredoxin